MSNVKKERVVRKFINSDPAWEAMKASRRNIDHDDAVQETIFLQKQFYDLWGHKFTRPPVDANTVLKTLIDKKISFVLIGAHSFGGWTGRPRAAKDMNILVKNGRSHAKTVNIIRALYPQLEERNNAEVTAFSLSGAKYPAIDIACPYRADLEETLANPVWTENKERRLRYRIPALEITLANKYGAMITPTRHVAQRMQDAADFSWMVVHSEDEGRQPIDLAKLEVLGEMVWPGGGRQEILRLVDQAKAGQPINLAEAGTSAKRKKR